MISLILKLVLLTTLIGSLVVVTFASAAEHDRIWPHPQHLTERDTFMVIDPQHFRFVSDSKCDLIDAAIVRYNSRLFVQDCSRLNSAFKGKYFTQFDQHDAKMDHGKLENVTIKFEGKCEQYPYMKMDESYQIDIDPKTGVLISSKTVWGALRGLETFSQLLDNVGLNQFVVKSVKIDDFPRFSHRGVLLDTSRHYLPMRAILQTLDAMEMNKFNVLHWHIVDDPSFPFVSETFPELSKKGAYDVDYIYTVDDVISVIEYARKRGIRVVSEFDTPGHTQSWGKAHPELLTPCYSYQNHQKNGQFGPLDPSKNTTFTFVEKLFTEIVRRFPDHYVHLGGDEVDIMCWASNPEVREFMKKMNFGSNYGKLEVYYIQPLVEIVQKLNHSYIVWQEVFDTKVNIQKDTVVHVWKDSWQSEMNAVTKAGYQTLLSSPWYLNVINYGRDWTKYYTAEPTNFNGTIEEQALVLGGEAAMWSEWVDASNVIGRTWPRACAVAERLWSAKTMNSADKARNRFVRQECRMQRLGLRVEPSDGPGHCQCDNAL